MHLSSLVGPLVEGSRQQALPQRTFVPISAKMMVPVPWSRFTRGRLTVLLMRPAEVAGSRAERSQLVTPASRACGTTHP